MRSFQRWSRRSLTQVIATLGLILVCYSATTSLQQRVSIAKSVADRRAFNLLDTKPRTSCWELPGANEVLIIMKTGATELEARLPTQLSTTLQCFPNRMLFSDLAEVYQGHTIFDALESVNPAFKENNADFELYRRLRDNGRESLASDELHGMPNETINEAWSGNSGNPGWKLDKWKNLPMVNRTFHEYPEMKWYVFIDADTYIIRSSLLDHLATLDHTMPFYSGSHIYIGPVGFAHGGSGYIVSQPAMRMVVEHFNTHQEEIEAFTDGHWAGDCVLGKAFTDAGVELTGAWPIIQGDYPGIVPYISPDGRPVPPYDTRIWCSPTISYHHMQSDMIEDLWKFEQEWLSNLKEGQSRTLRHEDTFNQYIMPRLQKPRDDWDNGSGHDVGLAHTLDVCHGWCISNTTCVQYALDGDGNCRHFNLPRLGKAVPGVKSGWLTGRIEQLVAAIPPC